MTRQAATQFLEEVLSEVRQRHPALRTDAIGELFEVGELRVGLEILCDNLLEDRLSLSPAARDKVVEVGQFVGVGSQYWNDLAVS